MKELYRKLSTVTTHELGLVMNYDLSVVGVAVVDFASGLNQRINVPHLLIASPQETPLAYWARFLAFLYNRNEGREALYQSQDEGWLFVFRDQEDAIVESLSPNELSIFHEAHTQEIIAVRERTFQHLPQHTAQYLRQASDALSSTHVSNLGLLPTAFHTPPDGRNRLHYVTGKEHSYSQYLSIMTENGNQGVLIDMDPTTPVVWSGLYEWLAHLMFNDTAVSEDNASLCLCTYLEWVKADDIDYLDDALYGMGDGSIPTERFLVLLTQADPVMRYICAKPSGALYHLHVLALNEAPDTAQVRVERLEQLVRSSASPALVSYLSRVFFHRVNRDHATAQHGFKAYQELNLKLMDQLILRFPQGTEPTNALLC